MNKQLIICMDLIGYIFITVPILATWSLTFLFFTKGTNEILMWLTPVFAIFTLSFFLFLMRIIIPKPQKGVITVGFNNEYLGWYMNLCLLRAFLCSGLRKIILSMAWSRYLIFKALGANVPYNFQMALNSEITDLTMVTIGEGCLIGDNAKITAHYIAKDKIVLRPVYLAPGTLILPHTTVKPGTKTEPNQVYGKGKNL
ncbi:MAG: hypothetical protein KC493_04960 [Bacteriovoracaceae bacterium]|nr:hypothetical protein [Bacteriovoracaceae bacterium]